MLSECQFLGWRNLLVKVNCQENVRCPAYTHPWEADDNVQKCHFHHWVSSGDGS